MIEFSATLKQPLTMEELEKITDSELEGTTKLFIKTPNGKVVTFIKVLEERPNEDCVSKMTKEEAKEIFLNRGYIKVDGGTIYDANKWCEACSVISEWLRQEGWIFVKDRLPEEDGRYLAYIVNEYDDKLQYIMICDYSVDSHSKWFPDDECASNNVIAWMPLPELPYKESEAEND